ncbi:hypothetical protein RIF29_42486 [Crotalaria pallida]|uniref:Uncharacterized protein n=1 Tax=Crotalaria pallida TaxID=3830 RepID=A0AAN9ECW3_CROPI
MHTATQKGWKRLTKDDGNDLEGKSLNGSNDLAMIQTDSSNILDPISNENLITPKVKDCSPYGPWMMVRRIPKIKGRGFVREAVKNGSDKENISPNMLSGSRFNALEDAYAICEEEDMVESNDDAMQEPCNTVTALVIDPKAKGKNGKMYLSKGRG